MQPIRPPWRVETNWWRDKPISREYHQLAPDDGPPLTVFLDLVSGEWFRQEYQ